MKRTGPIMYTVDRVKGIPVPYMEKYSKVIIGSDAALFFMVEKYFFLKKKHQCMAQICNNLTFLFWRQYQDQTETLSCLLTSLWKVPVPCPVLAVPLSSSMTKQQSKFSRIYLALRLLTGMNSSSVIKL